MTADNVQVQSTTGIDGNSYTTAVANDKLESSDYLKIFLEQLKSQDPTKPMDANQMLEDQLKMSQLDTNQKMIQSLESLSSSYKTSLLSSAVSMIGKVVENGETGEDGANLSYKVASVEQKDGEVYLVSNKITGLDENGNAILDKDFTKLPLSSLTRIF